MKRLNNKTKVLNIYIFIAIFVLFAIVSVFLTIGAVTSGSEISIINKENEALLFRQRELMETLVRGVSATELLNKSGELGFGNAGSIIYINENESVASR